MYDLLKILAMAKEFEVLRVRPEELPELRKVFERYWIFEDPPKIGIL
jgi:activating signal cointegrator complex subunit 3